MDSSIKQLTVFDKEEVQIASSGLVYIDNRIASKIFICRKENQQTCLQNIERIYGKLEPMPEELPPTENSQENTANVEQTDN